MGNCKSKRSTDVQPFQVNELTIEPNRNHKKILPRTNSELEQLSLKYNLASLINPNQVLKFQPVKPTEKIPPPKSRSNSIAPSETISKVNEFYESHVKNSEHSDELSNQSEGHTNTLDSTAGYFI